MASDNELILRMEHIDMFFPGVRALKDVSFNLRRGDTLADGRKRRRKINAG